MDRDLARRIADALTWARILSIVPITAFAWLGLSRWVFWLYIAAALTDLFDGLFARRASPPAKNIDFDGIADLVFSLGTLLWIWMLVPGFYPAYWLPYLPVLVLIEIHQLSVRLRWPDMEVPHFQFGRVTMTAFCFLLPVLLVFGDVAWFVHLILIMAVVSKLQLSWHFVICDKPARAVS